MAIPGAGECLTVTVDRVSKSDNVIIELDDFSNHINLGPLECEPGDEIEIQILGAASGGFVAAKCLTDSAKCEDYDLLFEISDPKTKITTRLIKRRERLDKIERLREAERRRKEQKRRKERQQKERERKLAKRKEENRGKIDDEGIVEDIDSTLTERQEAKETSKFEHNAEEREILNDLLNGKL